MAKRRKRTGLTKTTRDTYVQSFEQFQEERPGQMLVEDMVALDNFGPDSARIGRNQDTGRLQVLCADADVGDRLHQDLNEQEHIPVRILPRVTVEHLKRLPVRGDEDE